MMRRRVTLAVSSCLAVVLGLLPIAATAVVSRQLALDAERANLSSAADQTLKHAEETLASVESSLAQLDTVSWSGCSAEHLAKMRQLTIDDASAEEIGYYASGVLACTGWGPVDGLIIAREVPDYVLPSGAGLHIDTEPQVTHASRLLVLDRSEHNALVKPERLVPALLPDRAGVAVATTDGQLIASSGSISADILRGLIEDPRRSQNGYIHASAASDGLLAVAVADVSVMTSWFDDGRWILVPLGLLASAAFVAVVVLVSRQRLSVRSDVLHALKNEEFVAHYQPIIELATGRCIGAEALVRWRQPNGVLVPPDLFIPYAEQDDLILELTAAVIRRVTADLGSVLAGSDLHIAINVSARDMQTGSFLPVLKQCLDRFSIPPSRIWIEATERGFIDADAAQPVLAAARAAGHSVAIDDFGTGYSSLAMLEALPLDALKIDKSFVGAVGTDAAASIVTPHIIEMAHGLNLSIVAEGIETKEQEAYLRAAGVQYGQGWLYSKALPPEAFASYLRLAGEPPRTKAAA